jgi:hypothetical protein
MRAEVEVEIPINVENTKDRIMVKIKMVRFLKEYHLQIMYVIVVDRKVRNE